jgi:hypothetical protein
VPQLVRARVRLVGSGEVAEPAANLADLVVAHGRDVALEVVQLVAGRHRDHLRRLEVTAEPHDLGAVDAAGAREAGHVQPVAPAVRRLGPFGGPAEVTDVLARADRHAVDERRRVRLELAADCRGRALVEELEPLLDLTALHERAPLAGEREHLRVPVAEAPCELVRVFEVFDRRGVISLGEHRMARSCQCDASMFCGFLPVLEQALGGGEPALRDGERSSVRLVPRQYERDARGVEIFPLARVGNVGPLAQTDRLTELAAPPGGLAVPFEVLGAQACLIEILVCLERLAP